MGVLETHSFGSQAVDVGSNIRRFSAEAARFAPNAASCPDANNADPSPADFKKLRRVKEISLISYAPV